ncbi:MAG: Undecaprenyl phosphate-alpha-4-amino-4-deoxy-L-arabinose arabinosyl transferase [Smithella sp. PtaU1.Bin162]|nr:MAG: Undecaprenyl phosphate-alpha-4-amino-4-deoxy-L-arabinose arabinosyl transferase [Smithella sp. PtaU1.Bin162]
MQKRYILFLIPFILYIGLLSVLPQMEPDESRYSLIAAAMNESGNYVTPHIKNTVYLEKPPLVSWVTAGFFKIFGENDFSARLFAALCAWGCILLVYFIGKYFRDEKTGVYAAAILTVSSFHFVLGRINILDMPLTFFICLAVWLGYLALNEQKKYLFYLFYFVCALTFLIKGLIGVVFPFAIIIIWLIWIGRWRNILQLFSPVGILIFLAVVCPWIILAQKENPDFLWFFFVREHFLRFTTKMHGKTEPFYYYLPIIIAGTIPWSVYLIKACKIKLLKNFLFGNDENRLLIVWFLFLFLFYTMSSSKLATYIAPLFLPLALFAGCILKKYEENTPAEASQAKKVIFRAAVIIQSLLMIAALFLPPVLQKYSDAEKGLVIMISGNWWLYIILPVIALIAMTFLPDLIFRKFRKGWVFSIYALCALFLGSLLFPLNDFLAPYRSAKVVREAIALNVPQGQDLYQYRINFYGIDFYNKIRTPIVEDFGELSEGIVKLAPEEKKRYFLSVPEFFELGAQKKDIYCITQHKNRLQEITAKMSKTDLLWDNGAFYLLHIRN